jgi:hypothetical protein
MSAFGGKADIAVTCRHVRLGSITDMSTLVGFGFFGLPSNPETRYYSHMFGVHLGNPG